MGKRIDLTGQKFGKLTVIEMIYGSGDKKTYCRCKCDCGNEVIREQYGLKRTKMPSCGCARKEIMRKACGTDINGKKFSASSEYIKDVCMIYNDRKLLERLSRQAKVSTEMYSIRYFASKVEDVYRIAIKNYHRNLIPIFDKIKSMFGGKNK